MEIHEKLAEIVKEHGEQETLAYLQQVLDANQSTDEVTTLSGCPGHNGECGTCVGSVFIPCGKV